MSDFAFSFALSPSYGVTADGRVQRLDTGRWLKLIKQKRGEYLVVSLWEHGKPKRWPVHQIVCLTFHGPRPSRQHDAAHRDGNKLNNHYTNIRWATRSENERDKIAHGTSNHGARNGQSKLTDAEVKIIRQLYLSGLTQGKIAERFNLTQSGVSRIVTGDRWQ